MSFRRQSSRRDFLRGRSAVQALGEVRDQVAGQIVDGDQSWSQAESAGYLTQFGRTAMACQFQVFLNAGQHPSGPRAALNALQLVDELEEQLSVYRGDSELTRINQTAREAPVTVERRLLALLGQAQRLFRDSDGAFDITSGPLSRAWGFFRRQGRLPNDGEIVAALACIGGQFLQIDEKQQTVFFEHDSLEINVNSLGKGYALDRCAELLDVPDYLMHGGRSSLIARGNRRGSTDGWLVAICHPLIPDKHLAMIQLQDRGIGTSGSANQYFYHQGKKYSHVLDPRTGWPAEQVLSATVVCPSAAEADALATACFVVGAEQAFSLCDNRPDTGLFLVTSGDKSGELRLHTHRLEQVESTFSLPVFRSTEAD